MLMHSLMSHRRQRQQPHDRVTVAPTQLRSQNTRARVSRVPPSNVGWRAMCTRPPPPFFRAPIGATRAAVPRQDSATHTAVSACACARARAGGAGGCADWCAVLAIGQRRAAVLVSTAPQ
jgi:hypothetical protein